MEIKYLVIRAYRYRASGKWEYQIIKLCDTHEEARQIYHSNMAAIMKESNDLCMCVVVDTMGNRIEGDFSDTHTEPEPNEETE